MYCFCTIITLDYAPYSIALYKSLRRFDAGIVLKVLVIDANDVTEKLFSAFPGINIIPVHTLLSYGLVQSLYDRYAHTSADSFRWALKPVFMQFLLENGYEKVVFTDCDIFFFDDFSFLLKDLDTSAVLLTPHWRNTDPLVDEDSFLSLFTGGIFNAGFIAANKNGLPALTWWANACHYNMGAFPEIGVHDDQRYLDLLPAKFDFVKILRHQGCNVCGWNGVEYLRTAVNGQVLINGSYPIIFIHFGPVLIEEILKGHDPLLLPYLEKFRAKFEQDGTLLTSVKKQLHYSIDAGLLMKLKWKIKLRTRIKSFFFKLARRI